MSASAGEGVALRGMTWDHPRAYLALEAFEATRTAPSVAWDRQSLADFEAHPIDELAQRYDFMIVDHPGLGAAVGAGALAAYEDVFDQSELGRWVDGAIGASGASYRIGGRTWALPIDAAAQVAVRRPEVPAVRRWEDALATAAEHRATLCLAGPHAGLMVLAMCSDKPAGDPDQLLDPHAAEEAVDLLSAIFRAGTRDILDPIGVHELLASGEGATWCPLAYGYVSYADRLAWSDAPSWCGERPLSVLGGTGLALSARSLAGSAERNAVHAWVSAFLADEVQSDLVPRSGGQPATRVVWESREPFYAETVATLEAAWVRPRLPGWIALQDHLSELVREAIVEGRDAATAVADVNHRYAALRRDA
jgi:multiple sugar transport system substrate-binding protein